MTAREVERLLVRTAYPLTPIGKEDSVKLNQYEVARAARLAICEAFKLGLAAKAKRKR